MIDAHVHLEKGPLTKEYVLSFVDEAEHKGLTDLRILDHSHRFIEFEPMYEPLKAALPEQKEWLENKGKKFKDSLEDYFALIAEMKEMKLPLHVSFGLEVCYTEKTETFLKELLARYRFDFLVGAVHSIQNICYDMPYSVRELWAKNDVNDLYRKYIKSLIACASSGLFTQLAHPDTVKLFGYEPTEDMTPLWRSLCRALYENHMKAECNTGLKYRYNHKDLGLSDELLNLFTQEGVELVTASDAHKPEDVGKYIAEADLRIEKLKY